MRKIGLLIAALAIVIAACGGVGSDGTSAPSAGGPGDATKGEALFAGTCQTCHGPGGVGLEGLGKALIANEFVAANTDAELIAFIKVGRPAGDPDNTTGVDMPARGGNPSLSDDDLADIVAYLRTLQ